MKTYQIQKEYQSTYFFAALTRVNSGRWTAQQVKAAFNMNGQDGSDFDWFVSKLSSISDENVRINKLNEVESIFILAEAGWVPNHQTAAEVQSEIFNLLNWGNKNGRTNTEWK